jgi:hypothetical protein
MPNPKPSKPAIGPLCEKSSAHEKKRLWNRPFQFAPRPLLLCPFGSGGSQFLFLTGTQFFWPDKLSKPAQIRLS